MAARDQVRRLPHHRRDQGRPRPPLHPQQTGLDPALRPHRLGARQPETRRRHARRRTRRPRRKRRRQLLPHAAAGGRSAPFRSSTTSSTSQRRRRRHPHAARSPSARPASPPSSAKAPTAIRYSDHIIGDGADVARSACEMNLEGVISKRADAQYTLRPQPDVGQVQVHRRATSSSSAATASPTRRVAPSARSCSASSTGTGKLIYRGRVGTGFNDETLPQRSCRSSNASSARPAPSRKLLPKRRQQCRLGRTQTRRPGRLSRDHPRWPPAPSQLSRPARRQARQAP